MIKIFVFILTAYILIGCLVAIVILKLFEIGLKEKEKNCMEAMEAMSEDGKIDDDYELMMQIFFIIFWPRMLWTFISGFFEDDEEE